MEKNKKPFLGKEECYGKNKSGIDVFGSRSPGV